ncbi:hypothetical protein Aperf_G00000076693 [Anoplocephala perfoliata]
MDGRSKTLPSNKHSDLLNIDAEYAENLKILLESSPYKGSEVAAVFDNKKNGCQSDGSFDNFASFYSKETLSVPPYGSIPNKNPPYTRHVYAPEAIPEEGSISDLRNSVSPVQDAVRTYHTNFFQAEKEDIYDIPDVLLTRPNSNPVPQSKSLSRRNLSVRIQSLLENFESVNRQNDSFVSFSPDFLGAAGNRQSKISSRFASFSDTRSTAESCFVCNKVIYPLDRFSTGSHVYHKFCLRCSVCNRNLSPATCESAKDELFCRPHFFEKAHGFLHRMSTPVSLPDDGQNSPLHSITVECKILHNRST